MTRLPSVEWLRANAPTRGGRERDVRSTHGGRSNVDPPNVDPSARDAEHDAPGDDAPPRLEVAPTILDLSVDEAIVAEGDDVVLRWQVAGVDRVEIDGIGDVPAVGSARILAERSSAFVLRATNQAGEAERTTPDVRVLPMPGIGRAYVELPEVRLLDTALGRVAAPGEGQRVLPLRWMAPSQIEDMPGEREHALARGPCWTGARMSHGAERL